MTPFPNVVESAAQMQVGRDAAETMCVARVRTGVAANVSRRCFGCDLRSLAWRPLGTGTASGRMLSSELRLKYALVRGVSVSGGSARLASGNPAPILLEPGAFSSSLSILSMHLAYEVVKDKKTRKYEI